MEEKDGGEEKFSFVFFNFFKWLEYTSKRTNEKRNAETFYTSKSQANVNENVNKSTNILRSTTMTPTFGDLQPSDGSYSSFRATQPESGRLNVQVHRQRRHDWFSFPITHSERFDFWEKMNSDLTQFVWIHCDCFSSSPP
ncbi:hypothetical protein SDJN02_21645 [Cucurbita argyrosperma subsp. argyrosperma]|nr:hypothetical protein SDJN02_21645 [Cucurbita argyrosperma subsp. argyrosperma]